MHRNSIFGIGMLMVGAALSGCSTTTKNPEMAVGAPAYEIIPASIPAPTSYTIVPKDLLSIRVFGEEGLSVEKSLVDEAGFIQLPLAGPVKVAGLSAPDASNEIASILGKKYLVNPQVAVAVEQPAPRLVSVEGDVNKPGVYEIDGRATLLGAIARAESPLNTAKLDEIVIFRTINGQRMAARFNLKDIRGGISPDPIIFDGDVVMVGHSALKGLWQDVLKAAPIFNAFVVLSRNN